MTTRLLALLFAFLISPGLSKTLDPSNPNHQKLAAKYNAKTDGSSMLVMVNGRILFEDYPNRSSANSAYMLASGTKSFSGVLALAAQEDGLLNLDELVSKTLPEWSGRKHAKDVTIRQLLHLESGVVTGGERGRLPGYKASSETEFSEPPGTRFQYGGIPFQIFGEILTRKLASQGETVEGYLMRRILDPLNIKPKRWRIGPDGNPFLPHGASLTARQWAKFGEMVRLGGHFQGRRIIDQRLMGELFRSSPANPSYGLTWWMVREMSQKLRSEIPQIGRAMPYMGGASYLPDDLVMAAGAGRQRLYISRKLKLVVVRQSDNVIKTISGQPVTFRDDEFLSLLFTGRSAGFPAEEKAANEGQNEDRTDWILQRLDLNSNKKLERSELPQRLQSKFERIDRDGSGAIERVELRNLLRWRERSQ